MKNKHTWQFYTSVGLLLVALLSACSGSQPAGGANQVSANRLTTINVAAKDFSFSMDSTQVVAGTVTFIVKNDGDVPHDFSISGNGVEQKTPMIAPGKTATLKVDLAPGTYTYKCSVPGHSMLGMNGTFTVKSSS